MAQLSKATIDAQHQQSPGIFDRILKKVNCSIDEFHQITEYHNSKEAAEFNQEFEKKKDKITTSLKSSEKASMQVASEFENINNWLFILRSQNRLLHETEEIDKSSDLSEIGKNFEESFQSNAYNLYNFKNSLIDQLRKVIQTKESPKTARLIELYIYALNNLKSRQEIHGRLMKDLDEANKKYNVSFKENLKLTEIMEDAQEKYNVYKDRQSYEAIQKAKKYQIAESEWNTKKKDLLRQIDQSVIEIDEYRYNEKTESRLLVKIRQNESQITNIMSRYQEKIMQMEGDIKQSEENHAEMYSMYEKEFTAQRNGSIATEKRQTVELKKTVSANFEKLFSSVKKDMVGNMKMVEKDIKKMEDPNQACVYLTNDQEETVLRKRELFEKEIKLLSDIMNSHYSNIQVEYSHSLNDSASSRSQTTNMEFSNKNRLRQNLTDRDLAIRSLAQQVTVHEGLLYDITKEFQQMKKANKEKRSLLTGVDKEKWLEKKKVKVSIRELGIFVDKSNIIIDSLKKKLKTKMDYAISNSIPKVQIKQSKSMIYGKEVFKYMGIEPPRKIAKISTLPDSVQINENDNSNANSGQKNSLKVNTKKSSNMNSQPNSPKGQPSSPKSPNSPNSPKGQPDNNVKARRMSKVGENDLSNPKQRRTSKFDESDLPVKQRRKSNFEENDTSPKKERKISNVGEDTKKVEKPMKRDGKSKKGQQLNEANKKLKRKNDDQSNSNTTSSNSCSTANSITAPTTASTSQKSIGNSKSDDIKVKFAPFPEEIKNSGLLPNQNDLNSAPVDIFENENEKDNNYEIQTNNSPVQNDSYKNEASLQNEDCKVVKLEQENERSITDEKNEKFKPKQEGKETIPDEEKYNHFPERKENQSYSKEPKIAMKKNETKVETDESPHDINDNSSSNNNDDESIMLFKEKNSGRRAFNRGNVKRQNISTSESNDPNATNFEKDQFNETGEEEEENDDDANEKLESKSSRITDKCNESAKRRGENDSFTHEKNERNIQKEEQSANEHGKEDKNKDKGIVNIDEKENKKNLVEKQRKTNYNEEKNTRQPNNNNMSANAITNNDNKNKKEGNLNKAYLNPKNHSTPNKNFEHNNVNSSKNNNQYSDINSHNHESSSAKSPESNKEKTVFNRSKPLQSKKNKDQRPNIQNKDNEYKKKNFEINTNTIKATTNISKDIQNKIEYDSCIHESTTLSKIDMEEKELITSSQPTFMNDNDINLSQNYDINPLMRPKAEPIGKENDQNSPGEDDQNCSNVSQLVLDRSKKPILSRFDAGDPFSAIAPVLNKSFKIQTFIDFGGNSRRCFKSVGGQFVNSNLCFDPSEDFVNDDGALCHKYRHWNGDSASFDPKFDFYDSNGILHHIYKINLAPKRSKSDMLQITKEIKQMSKREGRSSEIGRVISYRRKFQDSLKNKRHYSPEQQNKSPRIDEPRNLSMPCFMEIPLIKRPASTRNVNNRQLQDDYENKSPIQIGSDRSNYDIVNHNDNDYPIHIKASSQRRQRPSDKMAQTMCIMADESFPYVPYKSIKEKKVAHRSIQSVRAYPRTSAKLPPLERNLDLGIFTSEGPHNSNFSSSRSNPFDLEENRRWNLMRGKMDLSSRKSGRIVSVKAFGTTKKTSHPK